MVPVGDHRLGLVPEGVELLERESAEVESALAGKPLDEPEAVAEAVGGRAQRRLGFDAEVTRHIHDGEEQVSDLGAHMVGVTFGVDDLTGFLDDLAERAVDIGPVEADLGCLALHGVGIRESGQ